MVEEKTGLFREIDGDGETLVKTDTGFERATFTTPEVEAIAKEVSAQALTGDITPVRTVTRRREVKRAASVSRLRRLVAQGRLSESEAVRLSGGKIKITAPTAPIVIPTTIRPEITEEIRKAAEPPSISRTPEQIASFQAEQERLVRESPFAREARIVESVIGAVRDPRRIKEKVGEFVKTELSAESFRKAREEPAVTAVSPFFEVVKPIEPKIVEKPSIPTFGELFPVETIRATPAFLGGVAIGLGRGIVRDPSSFLIETLGFTGAGRLAATRRLLAEERGFARTISRLDEPRLFAPVIERSGLDVPSFVRVAPEPVPGRIRAVAEARGQTMLPIVTEERIVTPEFAIRKRFDVPAEPRFVEPLRPSGIPTEIQTRLPAPSPDLTVRIPGKGFAFIAREGETIATRIIKKTKELPPIISLAPGLETFLVGAGEVIEAVKARRRVARKPSRFTVGGLIEPAGKVSIIPSVPLVTVPTPVVADAPTDFLGVRPVSQATGGISLIIGRDPAIARETLVEPVSIVEPRKRTGVRSRSLLGLAVGEAFAPAPLTILEPPITRAITRTRPRTITTPFIPPPRFRPPTRRELFRPTITKPSPVGRAFEVFVKRRGREVRLGTGLGRVAALTLGAKVTRETLAATFRISPVAGRVRRVAPFGALPSPSEFRTFRLVSGRRVPLVDTFIERRGKRLTTRGEVREIQFFKKKKKGGRFFL